MAVPRTTNAAIGLLVCVLATTATGCAARGPLFSPRASEFDDTALESQVSDAERSPIRLVSFPSIEVLPLWPDEDEVSETTASVTTPLGAGAEAVKRGAGQVKQGLVDFGRGAQRALDSTTNWVSRPFVAVRTTPGEPSFLQRMFSSKPNNDGPRTTREFLAQERVR